jgi:hypothetical protein
MASNNVAVFLDLNNLVIGAREANLAFNIQYILDYIKQVTNGRAVLRRAYGDTHQNRELMRELAAAGFVTQTNLALNNYGKNLVDMQITVDAMESLVDERPYHTYVLITGDQDFTPLAQALRKRDKHVIGIGIRHTTSTTFANLCDQYLYYEDIIPSAALNGSEATTLLSKSLASLEQDMAKVRASVLKQRMDELSRGAFANSSLSRGGFRKFLEQYPHLVQVQQEGTTTYVTSVGDAPHTPADGDAPNRHLTYRALLKKEKLRVVPAPMRHHLLKALVKLLAEQSYEWRILIKLLVAVGKSEEIGAVSRNLANATLVLARDAGITHVRQIDTLATAKVSLKITGDKVLHKAVVLSDRAYLAKMMALPERFDINDAALALYDTQEYVPYLRRILPTQRPMAR